MASEETYNDMISEKVITKKELKKIMSVRICYNLHLIMKECKQAAGPTH